MFGQYDIPLELQQEGISLSVIEQGDNVLYTRECLGEKAKKMLLASDASILINPVEPVNKPKTLSPYMLIAFETKLTVEPKGEKKIFLTFPTEIGAYIGVKEDYENIDIFSLAPQKYTLYGDSSNGVICKYWKSEVYASPPEVDMYQKGILEVGITNTTAEWKDISKAVFNAYGMKIYYNTDRVAMKAHMKIKSGHMAETDFEDAPLEPGMKNSLELYTAKKLSISSPKFVMEYGL